MNKFSIFFLLLFIFICESASAQPNITAEPKLLQFTQVAPEGKASLPCTITNSGSQPLVIQSVRLSCSCLTTDLNVGIIPPDASIKGIVTYDAENKDPGVYTHIIYIRSNDPDQPIFDIRVYALVEEPRRGLSLVTSTIVYNLDTDSINDPKYIEIRNNNTRQYHIRELNPVTGIDIMPLKNKSIPAHSTFRIEIQLQPWIHTFPFEKTVSIVTDDPNAPVLYCVVRAVKKN